MKEGDLVAIFPKNKRKYLYGVAFMCVPGSCNVSKKGVNILRGFWYTKNNKGFFRDNAKLRDINSNYSFGKIEGSVGFVRGRAKNCRFICDRMD